MIKLIHLLLLFYCLTIVYAQCENVNNGILHLVNNEAFNLKGCLDLQILYANNITNVQNEALANCPNLVTVEMKALETINGFDCTVVNKVGCSEGLANVFKNSLNIQTLIMPKIKIGRNNPFISRESKIEQLSSEEIKNTYMAKKTCT